MKFQTQSAFDKHLKGSYPSFASIYGIIAPHKSDRYLFIEKMRKGFLTLEPNLATVQFQGASLTQGVFKQALLSQSLFSSRNLVIVEDFDKISKNEMAGILTSLGTIPQEARVLFCATSAQNFKEILNREGLSLVSLDLTQEKPWDRKERCAWHLAQWAHKSQVQLSPEAAELLIDHIGFELPELERECEKLICYAGKGGKIDRAAVDKLVPMRVPQKRFKLSQDWVFHSGQVSPKEFEAGDLFQWLGQIRYHLQLGIKLLLSPESDLNLPMNPKEVDRLKKQAHHLGLSYFEKGLKELLAVEMLAKKSSLPEELLLHTYIGKLDYARKTHTFAQHTR